MWNVTEKVSFIMEHLQKVFSSRPSITIFEGKHCHKAFQIHSWVKLTFVTGFV
jgi:hypothetical protein